MDPIEHILWHERPLCYMIRTAYRPDRTTFLTPPEFKRQVGYVVYPVAGEIAHQIHRSLPSFPVRLLAPTESAESQDIKRCAETA